MSAGILERMGRRRALEGALELCIPLVVTAFVWVRASAWLGQPTSARGFTPLELLCLLGALGGLLGWAVGRLLTMAGRRRPWVLVGLSCALCAVCLALLPGRARAAFQDGCTRLGGELVSQAPWIGSALDRVEPDPATLVCQRGGVADNPYLPGQIHRPEWSGELSAPFIGFGLVICGLATLGTRHRRIFPTRLGLYALRELRYAAAAGHASAWGKPTAKGGRVDACINPTFWGEPCGQLLPAERDGDPGGPCPRCRFPFTPASRRLQLRVVTLFSADLDVLNGLERLDTVTWPAGEPIVPDARISGEDRWVEVGQVSLPDILTVAQALALVHDLLPEWPGSSQTAVAEATQLAMRRASRVSAWLWSGAELGTRLTYARPDPHARLAVGVARLRELAPPGSNNLWLQLDIGLLPLELRLAFRRPGAASLPENNKADLWIPVGRPSTPADRAGLWVPRVEGDALRAWLSLDRFTEDMPERSTPAPYTACHPDTEGAPPPTNGGRDRLDFVRRPLRSDGREILPTTDPGTSIAEWRWLEPEQIELLRQQALVLVGEGAREKR